MTRSVQLAVLVLAILAGSVEAGTAPPIPVAAFFSNPTLDSPRLSPDGKYVAVLYSQGDDQIVFVRPAAGSELTPVANLMDPDTRLNWLQWANADRLLLSGTARNKRSVGVRGRVTRMFGVDRTGGTLKWLGRSWPKRGQGGWEVQYQDEIVSDLTGDPNHILISYRDPYKSSPGVKIMNVRTGTIRSRQSALDKIDQWHADPADPGGAIRAGEGWDGTRHWLYARVSDDDRLVEVYRTDDVFEGNFGFAAFHEDPSKLYLLSDHQGRSAIFEFDIREKKLLDAVFSHPEVDVAAVHYSEVRKKVVGAWYIVDEPESVWIDEKARREHAAINNALRSDLGRETYNEIVSATQDGSLVLVSASSPTQPPVYYAYDRAKRAVNFLLEERPDVPAEHLAPIRRLSYAARDGLEIPAYLTLPIGFEPSGLPVIVLPHGGPWARDWKRYDPEVQAFANRGFAVFQMNFRGSTGYGAAFEQRGYREWGQAIQDDITDGVQWLIDQGVADPDRIGIYGGSYGGYAAMIGLIRTPGLYRAGASYAGVMDIETLINDDKRFDWGVDWHKSMIGGGWGDRKRLREYSPVRRAGEIRAPVLLGHGADDQRVNVRHSRNMASALRKHKKRVEYLEFENEIHGFLLEANRIQFYEALLAFFETELAPRAQSEPPEAGAGTGGDGTGAAKAPQPSP